MRQRTADPVQLPNDESIASPRHIERFRQSGPFDRAA
jgi:hypothetical protein